MPTTSICARCYEVLRHSLRARLHRVATQRKAYTRPTFAPKPSLTLKHIRQNPGLYEQNCIDRNYAPYARNGWRILEVHEQVVQRRREVVALRQRNNVLAKSLKEAAASRADGNHRDQRGDIVEEARIVKEKLKGFDQKEKEALDAMEQLALELPNLSSNKTPVGEQAELLGHINGTTPPLGKSRRSHVEVGKELDLLDFSASATTSGWGWYFLKNEAALLEQALIQYALSVAMSRGWRVMTPPSLVYPHIASACGFMPRDANGETQIYNLAGGEDGSGLVLAGTAEIPFAGSQANKTLSSKQLPLKVIGPSRCYRAEAGARGIDTKGLYRVHEFTKVEMFAWTLPPPISNSEPGNFDDGAEDTTSQTEVVFNEIIAIQTDILTNLGLHARILEMPTADLGASAARKIDIEAYFPSRTSIDNGYGEVTSASVCTDYQARRLNTKVEFERGGDGKLGFVETVNGTAMAAPRILAAILENGWEEASGTVKVPECLWRWMPGEITRIGPKKADHDGYGRL